MTSYGIRIVLSRATKRIIILWGKNVREIFLRCRSTFIENYLWEQGNERIWYDIPCRSPCRILNTRNFLLRPKTRINQPQTKEKNHEWFLRRIWCRKSWWSRRWRFHRARRIQAGQKHRDRGNRPVVVKTNDRKTTQIRGESWETETADPSCGLWPIRWEWHIMLSSESLSWPTSKSPILLVSSNNRT